jgi:hypothetical protein
MGDMYRGGEEEGRGLLKVDLKGHLCHDDSRPDACMGCGGSMKKAGRYMIMHIFAQLSRLESP